MTSDVHLAGKEVGGRSLVGRAAIAANTPAVNRLFSFERVVAGGGRF